MSQKAHSKMKHATSTSLGFTLLGLAMNMLLANSSVAGIYTTKKEGNYVRKIFSRIQGQQGKQGIWPGVTGKNSFEVTLPQVGPVRVENRRTHSDGHNTYHNFSIRGDVAQLKVLQEQLGFSDGPAYKLTGIEGTHQRRAMFFGSLEELQFTGSAPQEKVHLDQAHLDEKDGVLHIHTVAFGGGEKTSGMGVAKGGVSKVKHIAVPNAAMVDAYTQTLDAHVSPAQWAAREQTELDDETGLQRSAASYGSASDNYGHYVAVSRFSLQGGQRDAMVEFAKDALRRSVDEQGYVMAEPQDGIFVAQAVFDGTDSGYKKGQRLNLFPFSFVVNQSGQTGNRGLKAQPRISSYIYRPDGENGPSLEVWNHYTSEANASDKPLAFQMPQMVDVEEQINRLLEQKKRDDALTAQYKDESQRNSETIRDWSSDHTGENDTDDTYDQGSKTDQWLEDLW